MFSKIVSIKIPGTDTLLPEPALVKEGLNKILDDTVNGFNSNKEGKPALATDLKKITRIFKAYFVLELTHPTQLLGKYLAPQNFTEEFSIIETLVRLGADINAKNDLGQTALMMFAEKLSLETQALKKLGANTLETDINGKSALDYAKASKMPWTVRFSTENRSDFNDLKNDIIKKLEFAMSLEGVISEDQSLVKIALEFIKKNTLDKSAEEILFLRHVAVDIRSAINKAGLTMKVDKNLMYTILSAYHGKKQLMFQHGILDTLKDNIGANHDTTTPKESIELIIEKLNEEPPRI